MPHLKLRLVDATRFSTPFHLDTLLNQTTSALMPRRRVLASLSRAPPISLIQKAPPVPAQPKPRLPSTPEPQIPKLLTSVQHPLSQSALSAATALFTTPQPTHIYSSPTFRLLPQNPPSSFSPGTGQTPCPEIALLGASNAGKSSLINALFGRPHPSKPGRILVPTPLSNAKNSTAKEMARVSRTPGFTKSLELYSLSGARITTSKGGKDGKNTHIEIHPSSRPAKRISAVLVDTPGFGAASRTEWGDVVTKYIFRRKALRRVFLLLSCEAVAPWIISPKESARTRKKKRTAGVFTDDDESVVQMLKEAGVPWQVVLTKADGVLWPGVSLSSSSAQNSLDIPDEGMAALQNLVGEIQKAIMTEGEQIQPVPGFVEEVIVTSCVVPTGAKAVKFGIDALRVAIWNTVRGHV